MAERPSLSVTADELRALLREPESTTLEFKSGLPSEQEIKRLVAAFANTEGGTLVMGPLAHPEVVEWHAAEWANEVSPQPDVQAAQVELEPGQHFVVVRVGRGDQGLYLAEGQAVERQVERVAPMSAERIVSAIAPPAHRAGCRGDDWGR